MNRGHAATMADVAQMADVSVSTVSRVLSGSIRVRPETKSRIEGAIKTLGFQASAVASALASGRSRTVALLGTEVASYRAAATVQGIAAAARDLDYDLQVCLSGAGDSPDVSTLGHKTWAGVLILDLDQQTDGSSDSRPSGIPVVSIGSGRGGDSETASCQTMAAQLLTRHFLDLGHRTVHHITTTSSKIDATITGWRGALVDAELSVPRVMRVPDEPRAWRRLGRQLATVHGVTAAFCNTDELAMHVVAGLNDSGVRVPRDLSVAGIDGNPVGRIWTPPLTTIAIDYQALGRRALHNLIAMIADAPSPPLSAKTPKLIVRQSTAVPHA